MKAFTTLLLALSMSLLYAQQTSWTKPCGTPPGKSAWLKKYQHNPQAHYRGMDTTFYVPLSIHIVRRDDGNGGIGLNRLFSSICKLNADFADANMQFFVEGDIHYINNSGWYDHETVLEGAEMMFANNIENTINIYWVSDPAGSAAYNLPYAGIAMGNSAGGEASDVLAHEVGHNLSIQHPFLGWEGGVGYDNEIEHDYADPAPEIVLYDYTFFKDTLIPDTLIIDTAYVERTDGSNCHFAADGFCDTSPDYLGIPWLCNGFGESPQEQADPDGVKFRSDGSLIMGYADDNCQSRFTAEQIAAMRANLVEEKAGYLYNQEPLASVSQEPPRLLAPLPGGLMPFDEVVFQWTAVPNATHYLLQISPLPNFNEFLTDTYITTDTSLLVNGLANNRDYYWRARAYNSHSFCSPNSEGQNFRTGQLSSAHAIEGLSQLSIYPNPMASGNEALQLEFHSEAALNARLQWRSPTGQLLHSQRLSILAGNNRFNLKGRNLPAGLYFLVLKTAQGRLVEKVVIRDL